MSNQQTPDLLQPMRAQMYEIIERGGPVSAPGVDGLYTVVKDDEGYWNVIGKSRREKANPDEILFPIFATLAYKASLYSPAECAFFKRRAAMRAKNNEAEKSADR
jgi:hypothetical protein